MSVNIVTTEDLKQFRETLLSDIRELLEKKGKLFLDKWIRSSELMEKLDISPGTLQNLRTNGTIPYSKLEGILYYDQEQIDAIIKERSINLKNNDHEDSHV